MIFWSDALQRSYMSLRTKTRFSVPARSEDEEHTHTQKPDGTRESYLDLGDRLLAGHLESV